MKPTEFLEARLAETELLALEADWRPGQRPWRAEFPHGRSRGSGIVWNGTGQSVMNNPDAATCEHVAAWQPERALALVASIRAVLDAEKACRHEAATAWLGLVTAATLLTSIWSDHPDYNPLWKDA